MEKYVNIPVSVCLLVLAVYSLGVVADCQSETLQCMGSASAALNNSDVSASEKCRLIGDGLECIQNLECTTAPYMRVYYKRAVESTSVRDLGCEATLESEFYPPLTDVCEQEQRLCVVNYVDMLLERERGRTNGIVSSVVGYAACQDLANYVVCLKSIQTCQPSDSASDAELRDMVVKENTRMQMNCVVPSLEINLDYLDCDTARSQCMSITDFDRNNIECGNAQTALRCIRDLNCLDVVVLRLSYKHLDNRLDEEGESCDIDGILPVAQPSDPCDYSIQTCTNNYVDILLQISNTPSETRERLCRELNSYMECKTNLEACSLDRNELKRLVNTEVTRMRIGSCDVNVLDSSPVVAANIVLLMSSLLLLAFM